MKLSEYQEQCLTAEYLDKLIEQRKVIMYTAIPNSTWTPSFAQKAKNKKMGLNPGFPDLFIIGKKKIICIEMKRKKGGVVSPEQKVWLDTLEENGIDSFVAEGFDEAKVILDTVYAVKSIN